MLRDSLLQDLADGDNDEVVKQVQARTRPKVHTVPSAAPLASCAPLRTAACREARASVERTDERRVARASQGSCLFDVPDVCCLQEYFADYLALDSMFFSLHIENHTRCFMPQTWESQVSFSEPLS